MRCVWHPMPSLSLSPSILSPFPPSKSESLTTRPHMAGKGSDGGGETIAPPSDVVCCMCGDHGLSVELFRCLSCHSRYQHKYCSDLYPKVEHYKSCNWCLRDEGKNANSLFSSSSGESNNGGGSGVMRTSKLQRGEYKWHNKPVKKQRPLLERSASDVIVRVKPEEVSPGPRNGRQGPPRGKIRRYKLLEEVSS